MTTTRHTGRDDRVVGKSEERAAKNGKRAPLALSVIVPTRNEAGNIKALIARIESATAGISTEVIFVDDSTDGTPDVVQNLARHSQMPVTLLHRPPERRGNGLGGAVAEGIRAAKGHWVCVMDADLQHPPEMLPKLLERARGADTEIVIASRYAVPSETTGLSSIRFATSRICTLAARLAFPRRMRQVTDPLSGFFIVRRQAIDPDSLRPRGFKILLEILVRFPHLNVSEVPFHFQTRLAGESKASRREGIRFLTLLMELRFGGISRRFARFGAVGASGLVVNQLLLAAFTDFGGLHYLSSAVLATQGSTLWNFTLTETWVFAERGQDRPRLVRMVQFFLLNNCALLIRGPFLVILTSGLGMHYLISNLITLLTLGLTRYLLADGWIWADSFTRARRRWFNYDIHGIVKIVSEARLPELEYFRRPQMLARPDVRVRVAGRGFGGAEVAERDGNNHNVFHYWESLGRLGFWVEISRDEYMDVVVSPLLRFSPHVLYTNVVEPILRWMLVERGYALVHGACVAGNGKATLVTARTDTGKTTTILRLLTRERAKFLSDDMIILDRSGQLLCYPKPLTISRHTLEAVNGASLSLWQRLALQIQSRVHSKSGRVAALALAGLPLPMATINTIAQILVPPPKYTIDKLIPGIEIGRRAKICHLAVIERGPDHRASLDSAQAEQTLLRNCEDAYGFPPYSALDRFLPSSNGTDLRAVEREIIRSGLGECGSTLIRSETRNWWKDVQGILQAISVEAAARARREPQSRRGPARGSEKRQIAVDGTLADAS